MLPGAYLLPPGPLSGPLKILPADPPLAVWAQLRLWPLGYLALAADVPLTSAVEAGPWLGWAVGWAVASAASPAVIADSSAVLAASAPVVPAVAPSLGYWAVLQVAHAVGEAIERVRDVAHIHGTVDDR